MASERLDHQLREGLQLLAIHSYRNLEALPKLSPAYGLDAAERLSLQRPALRHLQFWHRAALKQPSAWNGEPASP
jgi:hypothetical protein